MSSGKSVKEVHQKILTEFGDKVVVGFYVPEESANGGKEKRAGESYIVIAPNSIQRVCHFLRHNPEMFFDCMMCLGGVDGEITAPEAEKNVFVVVYNLYSFTHRHRVCLHARLPKENPKIPSVHGVWSAANWFEREAYDLFGIEFENHPDLRRILLPLDWVGHPLRKDYEYPKDYNGISCVRAKLK